MDLFTNPAVDIATLPRADEVSFTPIEKNYWKVLFWGWLIMVLIVCLIVSFIIYFEKPGNILAGVISAGAFLFFILTYWLIRKSFLQKAYAIRNRDIIYRTGWLIRKVAVCPFNRIQHCSVNSGPFERKLGLASLSIFTAGSQGADLKIPGLKESTATELRDFIMSKTMVHGSPGN